MREKLIELLNQGAEKTPCHEECGDKKCNDCIRESQADHLIANGVTLQNWIPVSERLPKYGEIVLAFGKRHATSGQFRGTSPTKPNWWHWKGNMYKEVSHWMPLPQPPKGE